MVIVAPVDPETDDATLDREWAKAIRHMVPAELVLRRAILKAHHAALAVLREHLTSIALIPRALVATERTLARLLLRVGQREFPRVLRHGWTHGVQQMRERTARASFSAVLTKASPLIDLTFSLDWPELAEYIRTRPREYSPSAAHTTVEQFRTAIQRGIDEGWSIDKIKREIVDQDLPDISAARAERIARTEVISASNAGAQASYAASSVVRARQWLATRDARTRETHRAWRWPRDAQIKPIDEPFVIPLSGARLMYPGDTSLGAPPEEIVNCRCVLTPVVHLDGVF